MPVEGRRTRPAGVSLVETGRGARGDQAVLSIVLREGRTRQVRGMCEAVGHPVVRLRRVRIGPIADATLKPGKWRDLTRRRSIGAPARLGAGYAVSIAAHRRMSAQISPAGARLSTSACEMSGLSSHRTSVCPLQVLGEQQGLDRRDDVVVCAVQHEDRRGRGRRLVRRDRRIVGQRPEVRQQQLPRLGDGARVDQAHHVLRRHRQRRFQVAGAREFPVGALPIVERQVRRFQEVSDTAALSGSTWSAGTSRSAAP